MAHTSSNPIFQGLDINVSIYSLDISVVNLFLLCMMFIFMYLENSGEEGYSLHEEMC